MSGYSLSRSSGLYKFVFSQELEGFPEPRNDRISLGLFIGLFVLMLVIRPILFFFTTLFQALLLLICFLVDGSYTRGKFPTALEIVQIKPWPVLFGYRLPPWLVLAVGIVDYQYFYVGLLEAGEVLMYLIIIVVMFRLTKSQESSPAVDLAEAIGPVVEERLCLSYYREPQLFPALYLVD